MKENIFVNNNSYIVLNSSGCLLFDGEYEDCLQFIRDYDYCVVLAHKIFSLPNKKTK